LRCRERLKRPAATSRLFSCLADAAQRAHQHSFPTRRSSDLIVAKAPGSCTSALKTNPACYYHPFEFATNATRRGGRSGVVSPWPDCDERRHIASKRHLGGAGLQRDCASTGVCDTPWRLQHANGIEI